MMIFIAISIFLFGAYLFYLIFFWNWKKNCQPMFKDESTLIIGHRGSPTLVTENTIPSFKKAIDQGVDGLEFDIRLSKDKQIIIFHDATLKRLSNQTEKVSTLSLSELQSVELHKQKGQKEDTYIPSLKDVVPLLHQVKIINIEIKSDGLFKGHDILKPLIKFLNKYLIDNKCIVSSFNPLILMRLKLQRPETVVGFLYYRNRFLHGWNNMIWILRVQPENLHIHHSMLSHWIVNWAQKKGMRINSYTINDKKAFEGAKIDGLFTDNIEYLK